MRLSQVLLAIGAGAAAGLGVSALATKQAHSEYDRLIAQGRAELRSQTRTGVARERISAEVSRQVDREMRAVLESAGLRRETVDRAWALAQRLGLG